MRITIFDNQYRAVQELTPERQGAFWAQMLAYVFDGIEPQFSDAMERMAWNLVVPYLDKSITATQNGKKGGRKPKAKTKPKNQTPKPNSETKTESELRNQNQKPNDETQPKNQPLLEKEKERERLEKSLKDSLTLSHSAQGACAEEGAAPTRTDWQEVIDRELTKPSLLDSPMDDAAAELEAWRAEAKRMQDEAVPCPQSVLQAVGLVDLEQEVVEA